MPTQSRQLHATSRLLVIGIDQYPKLKPASNLHYAVADAQAVRKALVERFGFQDKNVVELTDGSATQTGVRTALAELADRKKVGADDVVVIYFSGHGATVKLDDGSEMGFLIPASADIDLTDGANAGPYISGCVSMREVRDAIVACPARHVLLIADACFAGQFGGMKGGFSKQSIDVALQSTAKQFMTAGGKGEPAWEDDDRRHGTFTSMLLKALDERYGAREVFSAAELASDITKLVTAVPGRKQSPQFGSFGSEGTFLFAPGGQYAQPSEGASPAPSAPITKPMPIPGGKQIGRLGIEFVHVPQGMFRMGSESGYGEEPEVKIFEDEKPVHQVLLDGYWISKTEVTVAQFRAFCEESGYEYRWKEDAPPYGWQDPLPMTMVRWRDARAFCKWMGGDLPTEAQWEHAAKGDGTRRFVWGDFFNRNWLAFGAGSPAKVGSYPHDTSVYGCLDMAGNVAEWCLDWYAPKYSETPMKNPTGPASGTERVQRPGSFKMDTPDYHSTTKRTYKAPNEMNPWEGFRVAVPE